MSERVRRDDDARCLAGIAQQALPVPVGERSAHLVDEQSLVRGWIRREVRGESVDDHLSDRNGAPR